MLPALPALRSELSSWLRRLASWLSAARPRQGDTPPIQQPHCALRLPPYLSSAGYLRPWPRAMVLFADLHQYTQLNARLGDLACTRLLHEFYRRCNALASKHQVQPLKTNGDEYMALAGLSTSGSSSGDEQSARQLCLFASQIMEVVSALPGFSKAAMQIRIGIACGPVVARHFSRGAPATDIYGQTVITAARLQRASQPGQPLVCATTASLLFANPGKAPLAVKPGPAGSWILLPPAG